MEQSTSIQVVEKEKIMISKMVIHFCFHHFFDCSTQKIFQSVLDIFGCLNIVFFQKLMDNVAFSLIRYNKLRK